MNNLQGPVLSGTCFYIKRFSLYGTSPHGTYILFIFTSTITFVNFKLAPVVYVLEKSPKQLWVELKCVI